MPLSWSTSTLVNLMVKMSMTSWSVVHGTHTCLVAWNCVEYFATWRFWNSTIVATNWSTISRAERLCHMLCHNLSGGTAMRVEREGDLKALETALIQLNGRRVRLPETESQRQDQYTCRIPCRWPG